ncbi:hypothetical protein NR402_09260 [Acidithiobacillus ferrooxidans]|uniref:hypothetical protein n=1 Tax=Acidithiobacillus ferrooxidans TaxID=920 RepID=UPI00214A9572|nr:hypothetical protein [Acidithiobacillus ferrooxidans]MCR2830467.1 hypothetical protein [Acidithiobacillus ferrooxidans]
MENLKKKEPKPSESKNTFDHANELYIFRDASAENLTQSLAISETSMSKSLDELMDNVAAISHENEKTNDKIQDQEFNQTHEISR